LSCLQLQCPFLCFSFPSSCQSWFQDSWILWDVERDPTPRLSPLVFSWVFVMLPLFRDVSFWFCAWFTSLESPLLPNLWLVLLATIQSQYCSVTSARKPCWIVRSPLSWHTSVISVLTSVVPLTMTWAIHFSIENLIFVNQYCAQKTYLHYIIIIIFISNLITQECSG
jgi:hypothetical protein